MILLITNKRDITTDYIVRELRKRKLKYYRLNTESLSSYECSIGYQAMDDWRIGSIEGRNVQSAYFRRPSPPEYSKSIDANENEYLASEWLAFLKSIYARLEGKWFNSPVAIALAEDKPKQLLLAKEAGFSVPNGLITNVTNDLIENVGASGLIIKPVRQGLIEGGHEKVIFTSRIPTVTSKNTSAISHVPSIFQKEIRKKFDVRVTIVGTHIFSVAIYSQNAEQTRVDWRRGGRIDLCHQIITLPATVERSCLELASMLNLRFGALDLICDKDDKYWFLEINPNGQWAWIENQTKLPIASAIVDELAACGS